MRVHAFYVIDFLINLVAFLLFISSFFNLHEFSPLLYSLFPLLPAARLLIKRGETGLIRRMKLLCSMTFSIVSLAYTSLFLSFGDEVLESFVRKSFEVPVVYCAAHVFLDHSTTQNSLLEADRKKAILNTLCALCLVSITYGNIYTYYNFRRGLIPDFLYSITYLIMSLLLSPWVYYLVGKFFRVLH